MTFVPTWTIGGTAPKGFILRVSLFSSSSVPAFLLAFPRHFCTLFNNCFTMSDSTQEASDSLRYTTPPNIPGELTGNSTTTLPDTTLADTPRTDRINKTYASFDTEDDATNERQDEIFAEQYLALATKHAQENAELYANATPRQRAIMDGGSRTVPLDLASSPSDSDQNKSLMGPHHGVLPAAVSCASGTCLW